MGDSFKKRGLKPFIVMSGSTHFNPVGAAYMDGFRKSVFLRLIAVIVAGGIVSSLAVRLDAKYTPGRAHDRGVLAYIEGRSDDHPTMLKWKWKPVWPNFPKISLPKLNMPNIALKIPLPTGQRYVAPVFEYLPTAGPAPLRFSDEVGLLSAAPSPALPEFSLISIDYDPYLIETPLREDQMKDNSVYADVVIDMQPVTIVSGEIDYDRGESIDDISEVTIEEERNKVVRAEDVLIFFESDSSSGETRTVVPFSPAQPSKPAPIESSATYKQE